MKIFCSLRTSSFLYRKNSMSDPIARLIYRLPPVVRVCIVLTGAVLIHLTIGTYHTFGNMLPYMASYMRNGTDRAVRLEHLMWIPTFQGCFPFSMVVGGWISLRLGPRMTAFIGCFITTSSVALSYIAIQKSFVLFFISYGLLYGFGMGIAYVTAVATVINWAPDKVGLISGIVAAGFGLSSSIFAPLQTRMVNPNNLPATKEGYFLQKELLDRVPHVFLTLACIYGAMQCLGLIVLCDPPEEIHSSGIRNLADCLSGSLRGGIRNKGSDRYAAVRYKPLRNHADEKATSKLDDEEPIVRIRNRSVSRESSHSWSSEESDQLSEKSDCERSMTPDQVLKSGTFHFLFVALFCCSFYANMFYNLYKTFAETFIEDDYFLALAFSLGSIVNAIARIAWGWLTDRTSFQTAVSTATAIASALLFSMPLTQLGGPYMYLLWLCGTFICMGATHALFITATVRCFGAKYKATNYGLLTLSTTFSGVFLSLISQFYLKTIGYTYLFLITAVFPFCAFLVTCTIQTTPQGRFITR